MSELSPKEIIKTVSPAKVIPFGLEGAKRGFEYMKIHRGRQHPYMLIFGPLGGLLIPDQELEPKAKPQTEGASQFLPMSPSEGPPLPRKIDVGWPWKIPE